MINHNYKGPERRNFVRIPFHFPTRFVLCGFNKEKLKEEGTYQYAYCNDIGLGGIQIRTSDKLKMGKYVKLKLLLPFNNLENKTLFLTGQVVWSMKEEEGDKYISGIQFLDVSDEEKEILNNFIKEAVEENDK